MLKRMTGTNLFWFGLGLMILGIGLVVLGRIDGSILLVAGLILLGFSARAPVWRLFAHPPGKKSYSVHDVRAATFDEAKKKLARSLPPDYVITEYEN